MFIVGQPQETALQTTVRVRSIHRSIDDARRAVDVFAGEHAYGVAFGGKRRRAPFVGEELLYLGDSDGGVLAPTQ